MKMSKASLKTLLLTAAIGSFAIASGAVLADITIPMYLTAEKGVGKEVGSVVVSETSYGLLFTPQLAELTPGIHGFHIHQNPSCEKQGEAAGSHFDPKQTEKHLGPYNDAGHLGDLPAITVTTEGKANLPVLAPRFKKLSEIKGHALMLHEGSDNYSDTPEKSGGGAARKVCGVISEDAH